MLRLSFDVTRASALPTHWSTFVGLDPEVMSCPPFAAGATGMKLLSRLAEIGLIRVAGIALPGKGVFVSGSRTVVLNTPARSSAVKGNDDAIDVPRMRSPWYEANPNTLFFRIGNPPLAPNWFWRRIGTVAEKKFRALRASLRRNSQAVPCNWLVPERVTAV